MALPANAVPYVAVPSSEITQSHHHHHHHHAAS